ncbi:hypothetical protein D3C86_1766850 [compost metagenome]
MQVHHVVKHLPAQVQQRMDPEVFHDPLREISENIRKQYRADDHRTHDLQCTMRAESKVGLLRVIVEHARRIEPAVFRPGIQLPALVKKKRIQERRQKGQVQCIEYDSQQGTNNVWDSKTGNRLSKR